MTRIFITSILFTLSFFTANAQGMRVERGDAVNNGTPVWNIYIDDSNVKWVGNTEGLFQVHSINNSSDAPNQDDWLLERYRCGNAKIKLSKEELSKFIPNLSDINCAHYDKKGKHLWIGTTETGLYELALEPLKLVRNYTFENSELNTNFIKFVEFDDLGRIWIGTDEGVVWGNGKRWNLDEEYLNFVAVAYRDNKTIIVSDEWMWEVNAKGRWKELRAKEEEQYKGAFVDAAVDSEGRLWLASEIISRYDFTTKTIEAFASPEYYTSEFASVIAVDQEDALWVGTRDKGLFLIEKEEAITVSALIDQPLSCDNTKKDASLKVIVEGGKPPYQYNWNNGLKGKNPQNIGVGKYKLTVTDSKGKQKTASVTINNPKITVSLKLEKVESAFGAGDGVVKASVKGGQPKYKYAWDNGETKAKAVKLKGGQHSLTVTDEAGCSAVASIEVGQNIVDLAVGISISKKLECAGDKTGALDLDIKGGKQPYTIEWKDGLGAGQSLTGLGAGNYQVTVTDARGKTGIVDMTLQEPAPVVVEVATEKLATNGQANGKATAKVRGGKTPYRTFTWSNGEKKETATKLATGSHQVTVVDAKGCEGVGNVSIGENVMPLNLVVEVGGRLRCQDDENGKAEIAVKGGKAPYTYKWSAGKGNNNVVTGLKAGTYTVTATDAKGQTSEASFNIKSPEAIVLTTSADAPAKAGRNNGQASVKVKGGKSPYTYAWDNGEADKKAKKLSGGKHTVTVTDNNGCTAVGTVSTSEDISPLVVKLEVKKEVLCFGTNVGEIGVNVEGGKEPYQYAWSNGQRADKAVKLKGGKHTVTVTDVEGTTQTASIQLKQPEPLGIEITKTSVSKDGAKDGGAFAKGVGGVKEYSFKWSSGEEGNKVRRLDEGAYTVTMTDANGCTTDMKIEIKTKQIPQLRAGALRPGQTIKLDKLYFDADSASITPQSVPTLDELRDFLVDNPTVTIEVGGHTNNIPSHEFCDKLSTDRAKSVAVYLTQRGIVDPKRVTYKGYGKRKPKYTNKTREGRDKNQRVEIKLLSL